MDGKMMKKDKFKKNKPHQKFPTKKQSFFRPSILRWIHRILVTIAIIIGLLMGYTPDKIYNLFFKIIENRTYVVVNCEEWITLRSEPNENSADLAHIPLGNSVEFIEVSANGFLKVKYKGKRGYVLSRFLAKN